MNLLFTQLAEIFDEGKVSLRSKKVIARADRFKMSVSTYHPSKLLLLRTSGNKIDE